VRIVVCVKQVPDSEAKVTVAGTNDLLSAGQSGRLSLVSPMRITSSFGFSHLGFATETFVFAPEPGMAALLGSGVVGLL
jgi:hypothetical protein